MKQKLAGLVGIFFLIAIVGIVVTVIRSRAPKEGELKVDSDPLGSVFLNDKHIGRSPIGKPSYKVTTGDYDLKIVPDTGISTYATFQEKIRILPNALTYVEVKMGESELTSSSYVLWLEKMSGGKEELAVITTPDSATVLLDDEPKGTSPLTIPDLTPGDHTLTVTSRGFVTKQIKIRISEGYRLVASVKLALGGGMPPESSPSATPEEGTPTLTPKISPSGSPKPTPTKKAGVIEPEKPYITVKDNEYGFLRVRSEAGTASPSAEVARIAPGDQFHILDTKSGWYQIEYESGKNGWISGSTQWVEKTE